MKKSKGDPQFIRGINDQLILDLIYDRGELSRAEASRLSGLSKPTVSASVQRLLERGCILETGRGENKNGRKAMMLNFNLSAYYVCGIDMNVSSVHIAVARPDGSMVDSERFPVPDRPQQLSEELKTWVERLLQPHGIEWNRVLCVAMGVPAIIASDTGEAFLFVDSLKRYQGFLTAASLSKALDCRVLMENDVNLAALAEMRKGAAHDKESLVYLSIDKGVGAGLVIGGSLVQGLKGGAGEVGQMRLEGGARAEDLISEDGLMRLVRTMGTDEAERNPREEWTANRLFMEVRSGNEFARDVMAEYGRLLAKLLYNICALLAPERIVLGGSVGMHADVLIPFVLQYGELSPHIDPDLQGSILGGAAVIQGAVDAAVRDSYAFIRQQLLGEGQ